MFCMNDVNTAAPAPLRWSAHGHVVTHHPADLLEGRGRATRDRVFTLDLDAAAQGVTCDLERRCPADRFLGLDLGAACPPADVWLRGPDVTAVYEPADARRLRATAMWRLHPTDSGRASSGRASSGNAPWFACEVIASVQTAVLESDSAIAITAEVADGSMLWGCPRADGDLHWIDARTHATPPPTATCLLIRRKGSSVAVAVHPGDVRRIDVQPCAGGETGAARRRVTCWLFTGTTEKAIEKGVLLRGRVFAACGPAADDVAWAGAAIREFNASPPPLTT